MKFSIDYENLKPLAKFAKLFVFNRAKTQSRKEKLKKEKKLSDSASLRD
jgi:hypothetical protein